MTIRITFDGKQAGRKFTYGMKRQATRVTRAASKTARDVGELMEKEGRANILMAKGKFGSRWRQGLHAKVTHGGGNYRISMMHDVPYWRVFEYGATIHGKPLLWIPLSFATDAKGVRARDYPGQLFRVDRKSGAAPLLLTPPGIPKYFGKASVTIPQKFHLREVAASISRDIPVLYRHNLSMEK